jgi:hypothetical protein
VYVPRTGQINAWDKPAWVRAIEATKRKTLIIAGTLTIARVVQTGAMPIDTYAVLAELMSTWNRPDAMDFAAVMVDHIVPPYRALMESYDKAQSVQKVGRETKLDLLEEGRAKR